MKNLAFLFLVFSSFSVFAAENTVLQCQKLFPTTVEETGIRITETNGNLFGGGVGSGIAVVRIRSLGQITTETIQVGSNVSMYRINIFQSHGEKMFLLRANPESISTTFDGKMLLGEENFNVRCRFLK